MQVRRLCIEAGEGQRRVHLFHGRRDGAFAVPLLPSRVFETPAEHQVAASWPNLERARRVRLPEVEVRLVAEFGVHADAEVVDLRGLSPPTEQRQVAAALEQ